MEVKMKELSIKEQKSLFGGHFHTVGNYRCPGLTLECMFIGGSGALQRGDKIIVFKCLLIGQRQGLSQRFGKWHTVYDCATL